MKDLAKVIKNYSAHKMSTYFTVRHKSCNNIFRADLKHPLDDVIIHENNCKKPKGKKKKRR